MFPGNIIQFILLALLVFCLTFLWLLITTNISRSTANYQSFFGKNKILYTEENLSDFYDAVQPGDKLKFPRGNYSHYAIYIGGFEAIEHGVVELNPGEEYNVVGDILNTGPGKKSGKIEINSVEDALNRPGGGTMLIDNEMDHLHHPFKNIVERAIRACVDQPLDGIYYSLVRNNCEQFVNVTRYGVHYSEQVQKAMLGVGAAGLAATAWISSRK